MACQTQCWDFFTVNYFGTLLLYLAQILEICFIWLLHQPIRYINVIFFLPRKRRSSSSCSSQLSFFRINHYGADGPPIYFDYFSSSVQILCENVQSAKSLFRDTSPNVYLYCVCNGMLDKYVGGNRPVLIDRRTCPKENFLLSNVF